MSQGKWPVCMGIGRTQPAIDATDAVLAPFAYRFSPFVYRFTSVLGPHTDVKRYTNGLPLSKRSQYGLKRYTNGLKRYANGASTASVNSRLSPSYARVYRPFSLCMRYIKSASRVHKGGDALLAICVVVQCI